MAMMGSLIRRARAGWAGRARAAGIVVACAIAAMLAPLAGAPAAAAALQFDGETAAVSLPASEGGLTGADLSTIELAPAPRFAPEAGTPAPGEGPYAQPDATLLTLSAGPDLLVIGLGDDETHIVLIGDGQVETYEVGALGSGGPVPITMRRAPGGGWQVAQGAAPLGDLPPGFFDPAPDVLVRVALGGPAFVGVIEGFRIASAAGAAVVEVGAGGELSLAKTFSPRLGLYRQNDARLQFDGLDAPGGIVYPRIRSFALVEHDGRLGLVFDWGGFLALTPDPQAPRRYLPADPRFAWAGAITFDDANDRYFTASGVAEAYAPAVPLLENGERYGWWKSLAEQPYPTTRSVSLASAFAQNAPSNFGLSIDGCYDLTADRSTSHTPLPGAAVHHPADGIGGLPRRWRAWRDHPVRLAVRAPLGRLRQ